MGKTTLNKRHSTCYSRKRTTFYSTLGEHLLYND